MVPRDDCQTLGNYHIVEKIGVGEMGEVYCAHDHQLDCDVALKVLLPGTTADETARELFRKKALALAKLNHPTSKRFSSSTHKTERISWRWS